MQSLSTAIAALLTVAVVFSATSRVAEAQQADCASSLVPCAQFLNTTGNPSTACCDAIRQVVATQLACLCNLYNTPGLLSSLGINATQALELPRRCNIPSETSACSAVPPGASTPGRIPGGNSGNGGGNGVGTISWSAMPALLLLWAVTYLY